MTQTTTVNKKIITGRVLYDKSSYPRHNLGGGGETRGGQCPPSQMLIAQLHLWFLQIIWCILTLRLPD